MNDVLNIKQIPKLIGIYHSYLLNNCDIEKNGTIYYIS